MCTIPHRMKTLLLVLGTVVAGVVGDGVCLAQDPDDWGKALSGAGDEAVAQTGILGMSDEDLQAYTEAEIEQEDEEVPEDFIPNRRQFVMREMMFNADWNTDPTAVPAFVEQLKRRTGMRALALSPRKPIAFSDAELLDWPFVYMTAHNAFTFSDEDVENLRRFFLQGGFLYVDDCLYGFPFGQALPGELQRALPDSEFTPLEPKHPVFGTVLRQKYDWGHKNEAGLPTVMKPNFWHYLEVDGYIVALYTPQDIGCLWEISSPPTPSNPLGAGMHSMDRVPGLRESAYRLGVNIVLYSMLH